MIEKLVSGGQTGADIAALDVARRHGFPHGGWCPKGRQSEAGADPRLLQADRDTLGSATSSAPSGTCGTRDGTVVFTLAAEVTGGSLRTIQFAGKHGKPVLHRLPGPGGARGRSPAAEFVEQNGIKVLNVAGSRESKEPGIHGWVVRVLEEAFFRGRASSGRAEESKLTGARMGIAEVGGGQTGMRGKSRGYAKV